VAGRLIWSGSLSDMMSAQDVAIFVCTVETLGGLS
jgi:hypothetical protein